jgi:hypothetical protein
VWEREYLAIVLLHWKTVRDLPLQTTLILTNLSACAFSNRPCIAVVPSWEINPVYTR